MKRNIALSVDVIDNLIEYFNDLEASLDCKIFYDTFMEYKGELIFIIEDKNISFFEMEELNRTEKLRRINIHVNSKKVGSKITKEDMIYNPIEQNESINYYGRKINLIQNSLELFIKPKNELIGKKMPESKGYDFITIDNLIRKQPYIIGEIKTNHSRIVNFRNLLFLKDCMNN